MQQMLHYLHYTMEINFGRTDISLVNVIRRIILRDVYTYAIEKVTIVENTSVMHDEMLTDRLALVPLRVTYNGTPPECIQLNMNISCENGTKNVYSRDILHAANDNVDVTVPHPDILLAVLTEGQCINIQAECIRGNGEQHYKFAPTTTTDVIKEGNNVKLYAELIGQITKDELLEQVSDKFKNMTHDVLENINTHIDN